MTTMEHSCALCFEDMDMQMWNDEHDSTLTCYKLPCGHAYHTKCIIDCLTKSNIGCPNCNSHKSPREEFTRRGLLMKAISDIKKNPELRYIKQEYKQSIQEIVQTRKRLQKEAREFIQQRKKDLCFDEKRSYYTRCLAAYKKQATDIAKTLSPMHFGATHVTHPTHRRLGFNEFEMLLVRSEKGYRIRHLNQKTIYVSG